MALINIPDPGAKYTDEEIKALEEKINDVYSEAQSDLKKKLDDFTAKFKKKDAEFSKQCQDGIITKEEYAAWRKGQVFTGKQWIAKKKEITAVLDNSNKIAAAMINSSAIGVFGENANFLSYSLEHAAGANFGFGLYNTDAVTKLIKDDPQVLPKWKIDQKKDYVWNQQNLNRSLTQGIIQGESLDKISKRVSTSLAGSNQNLMNTFAKTGMTQAQNSGRLTQLERAKALGLNVKKEWVATLDARTRTSHQELDGQSVDLDKPFKAEGYSIRYPGDPQAHPSLVYNCRCALVGDLIDYPATYNRYDNIAGKPIKGMSYKEWKEAKAKGDDLTPVPFTYKTFKNAEQKMLEELFKSKSMSGLYNDIKAADSKAAGQFYKTLGENGKPSENWQKYIDGTMPKAQATKIDAILKKYGEDAGLIKEPVNISEAFKDKKMSNVFNEIKASDKTAANKFYSDLKTMGKPSEVWDQYLNGKLDPSDVAKIDGHLEKYLKKLDNVAAIDYEKFGGKEIFDIMTDYDSFADFASNASSKKMAQVMTALKGKSPIEIDELFTKANAAMKADAAKVAKTATDEVKNAAEIAKAQKKLEKLEDQLKKYQWYDNKVEIQGEVFTFEKDGKKVHAFSIDKANELLEKGANPMDKFTEDFSKVLKGVKEQDLYDKISAVKKEIVDLSTTKSDDLIKAEAKLKKAKDALDQLPNSTYSGIWKDDVTLADYESKKSKIAAKKKYYEDQITKYQGSAYADIEWAPKEIEKMQDHLKNLEEFETKGKEYAKLQKAVTKAQQEVRSLTPVGEAFTPERKNAALWATTSSEYKEVDKIYDKVAKQVHSIKSPIEHEGYYHYTWGSGPFNQPLAGFTGSWSQSDFKGVGKVDINYNGYGSKIRGLTSLIEKSTYDQDIWIQSGQNQITIEAFLNIPAGTLRNMTNEELQQFVGVENKIPQFISGAVNKGGGSYTPGDSIMNIYCPSGSEMLYVRSDGHFGKSEHEMILQRGGTYKLERLYWGKDEVHGGKKLIADFDLHSEMGYDKFQQ